MTATIDTRAPERAETDAEIIGAALSTATPPAAKVTTITVPSVDELQRVLTNALLAAETTTTRYNARPPLQCVSVTVTDGLLEIVTTDSYRMMHQAPGWEVAGADNPAGWMIHRDELAKPLALIKATPKRERELRCDVVLTFTDRELRIRSPFLVVDLPYAPFDFPNWRQLVPGDNAYTGTGAGEHGIALNPRFVADLAKYRPPNGGVEWSWKLRTQDHLKPAMFTLSGEAWYLLMPVRTS